MLKVLTCFILFLLNLVQGCLDAFRCSIILHLIILQLCFSHIKTIMSLPFLHDLCKKTWNNKVTIIRYWRGKTKIERTVIGNSTRSFYYNFMSNFMTTYLYTIVVFWLHGVVIILIWWLNNLCLQWFWQSGLYEAIVLPLYIGQKNIWASFHFLRFSSIFFSWPFTFRI